MQHSATIRHMVADTIRYTYAHFANRLPRRLAERLAYPPIIRRMYYFADTYVPGQVPLHWGELWQHVGPLGCCEHWLSREGHDVE